MVLENNYQWTDDLSLNELIDIQNNILKDLSNQVELYQRSVEEMLQNIRSLKNESYFL